MACFSSSWFREYVYIPLGGNRKGTARTYINRFSYFFSPYLAWRRGGRYSLGILPRLFNILERCFLGKWMGERKSGRFLERGLHRFCGAKIGWVIFPARLIFLCAGLYPLYVCSCEKCPHDVCEKVFDTKADTVYGDKGSWEAV